MKVGDDIQCINTDSTSAMTRRIYPRDANATRNSQDKIQVSMVKGESKVSTRYNQVTVVAEM